MADGSRSIDELARQTHTDPDALRRVIRLLAALGVFRIADDRVETTELGHTLAEGHAGSLRHLARFWMHTHYEPFSRLLHTVSTGDSAADRYFGQSFFDWLSADARRIELLGPAFANITTALRENMFADYRLPEGAVVADIGGADGSLLARLLADSPEQWGVVFDRPEVISGAQQALSDHGLGERLKAVGGDFFVEVPAADVYVLSTVLHDWRDSACRQILGNIAAAARPGARLVIMEAVVTADAHSRWATVSDVFMLGMLAGRERTAEEFRALLDSAGFTLDRVQTTPAPFSILEGTLTHPVVTRAQPKP